MIANWFAWVMHVAVMIAAGILASQCFHWKRPQSRMRFYQLLLLTGIALPLIEPRRALRAPAVIANELVLRMQSAPVSQMATGKDWVSILIIGRNVPFHLGDEEDLEISNEFSCDDFQQFAVLKQVAVGVSGEKTLL